MSPSSTASELSFPDGAEFAFTILDDTDDTTVANGRPIYQLLSELGLRTTKTVWALDTPAEDRGPYFAAETLQDPHYLEWVRELDAAGFEIAFHNASMGSSLRSKTESALDFIAAEFPGMPRVHCNHGRNRENLHWGPAKYSSAELSGAMRALGRLGGASPFEGHVQGSPYYWEDLASKRIDYVRRFAFLKLDCGAIPPGRPFVDERKRAIRCWFNTADAADASVFKKLVTPAAIDALRSRRSWCIVSTHLGKGFVHDQEVDADIRRVLEHIASLPGWFAPVGELLDHLVASVGARPIGALGTRRMEYAHVLDRIRARITGQRTPRADRR